MAFQHPQLAQVLEYRFKDNPNFNKGITTVSGTLTFFHPAIGSYPTDAELTQWVQEFEALSTDHQAKNPRAAKLKRLQGSNSIAALRQFIEEELL